MKPDFSPIPFANINKVFKSTKIFCKKNTSCAIYALFMQQKNAETSSCLVLILKEITGKHILMPMYRGLEWGYLLHRHISIISEKKEKGENLSSST